MKVGIHPTYHQAKVTCACGNVFSVGSTRESINVELCSKCHPFYTGEQRFVDTANKIDKFKEKMKTAAAYKVTAVKKQEEVRAKQSAPKTLAEMLASLKK
jgi:large subunit ribosomal protein L31